MQRIFWSARSTLVMWMESHELYLSRRAREERRAAMKAIHPQVREAHLALAEQFDRRFEEFMGMQEHQLPRVRVREWKADIRR